MSNTPSIKLDFNGDQVIESFMVPPDQTAIISAMRFMFRMMKDEIPPTQRNTAKHIQDVAELTIEEIRYRYCLLKEYAEEFFFGEDFDADALAIAAICGPYTTHIGDTIKTANGDIIENNYGIEEGAAERAAHLWEDAFSLMQKAITPHECSNEAVFLAHVLTFENFAKHEENYEEYEDEDFRKIAQEEIPATRAFLRTDTNIGAKLKNFMVYMDQEVTVRYVANNPAPPRKPPAPVKPNLTLVPPAPNG